MDKVEPAYMPYELLTEITDSFSDERIVGSGAFGVVYKGEDKDQVIAVKILNFIPGVNDNDFDKEFNNLAKLRHENIVQLLGYCNETEDVLGDYKGKQVWAVKVHRALCFEYMQNGSLHNYLQDADHGFSWNKRYRIIKGICEGLKYLHMGTTPIYHLDLKPHNILLDNNMVPKIADFGLSRLLGEGNTTKVTASAVGTCGYLPPEYINKQIISKEFDIFSLGVIIIKIIMGSAGYSLVSDMEQDEFIEHVCNKWRERLQVIGRRYTLLILQVKKCIEIAWKCIETDKNKRPTIGLIVEQLNETERHTNHSTSWMEESDDREPIPPESNSPARRYQGHNFKNLSEMTTDFSSAVVSIFPKEIPASFLKKITKDFSPTREIGKDAFGTTYKGITENGEMIAVKKLRQNSPVANDRTFNKEVCNLSLAQHENIVKLVGYCYESQKKVVQDNGRDLIVDIAEVFLCYEYLPKGSLDNYIFAEFNRIDWDTRFRIVQGICNGLHFLHKEMDQPIVHMDLKPENILLDDNMIPKIADFGLSRLFGQEQTRTNTQNVVGSIGYMAPEYLYRGEMSTQSDIYSLGLLIIEISTRGKIIPNAEDKCGRKFIEKVQKSWTDGHISSMYTSFDPDRLQQIKMCVEIGLQCVELERKFRPSIADIVEKLNGMQECCANTLNFGRNGLPNDVLTRAADQPATREPVIVDRNAVQAAPTAAPATSSGLEIVPCKTVPEVALQLLPAIVQSRREARIKAREAPAAPLMGDNRPSPTSTRGQKSKTAAAKKMSLPALVSAGNPSTHLNQSSLRRSTRRTNKEGYCTVMLQNEPSKKRKASVVMIDEATGQAGPVPISLLQGWGVKCSVAPGELTEDALMQAPIVEVANDDPTA